MRSVITLTNAQPGAGKTYQRAAWFIMEDWLLRKKRVHYSNFPLRIEEIERRQGVDDISDRVQVIPPEEMKRWEQSEDGEFGPWTYFAGKDLSDCHIAIDEAKEHIPRTGRVRARKRWGQWLSDIRHEGCTVEFLSQDISQLDREICNLAGLRYELIPARLLRDRVLKIPMDEWYRLLWAVTGYKYQTYYQSELVRMGGRWKTVHQTRQRIKASLFDVYDSFNAIHGQGSEGKDEYEGRRFRAIFDFVATQYFHLLPGVCLLLGLYMFFGPPRWWDKAGEAYFKGFMGALTPKAAAQLKTTGQQGLHKKVGSEGPWLAAGEEEPVVSPTPSGTVTITPTATITLTYTPNATATYVAEQHSIERDIRAITEGGIYVQDRYVPVRTDVPGYENSHVLQDVEPREGFCVVDTVRLFLSRRHADSPNAGRPLDQVSDLAGSGDQGPPRNGASGEHASDGFPSRIDSPERDSLRLQRKSR